MLRHQDRKRLIQAVKRYPGRDAELQRIVVAQQIVDRSYFSHEEKSYNQRGMLTPRIIS